MQYWLGRFSRHEVFALSNKYLSITHSFFSFDHLSHCTVCFRTLRETIFLEIFLHLSKNNSFFLEKLRPWRPQT